MVRPVLHALQVDRLPALNHSSPRSAPLRLRLRLLSPRPAQAFLFPPTDTPTPHPHSAEASLRRSTPPHPLYRSPHPPISPLTSSARRGPSPGAAGRHDPPSPMQVQAAAPSFYEVLGLADDVAIPDIKTAYRQMARKFHPDVCPPANVEESTRKFMAVQEAYETLSDPAKRASYDRTMSSCGGGSKGWGWPSNDKEVRTDWKYHWEDQLFNMQQWSATKETHSPYSWGARMRKQRENQHQDHEYAC